jgi:hypothetical protein
MFLNLNDLEYNWNILCSSSAILVHVDAATAAIPAGVGVRPGSAFGRKIR